MDKHNTEEYWPSSPYSQGEQQVIMRDLHKSMGQAFREKDVERLRNLREIKR